MQGVERTDHAGRSRMVRGAILKIGHLPRLVRQTISERCDVVPQNQKSNKATAAIRTLWQVPWTLR